MSEQLWECDGCFAVVESAPHAHDDTGGKITIFGPRCAACDQPMSPIPGRLDGDCIIEEGHEERRDTA